jgi:hypothetical protein
MAIPKRLYRWEAQKLLTLMEGHEDELCRILGRKPFGRLVRVLAAIQTAKSSHTLGVDVLAALGQTKRGRGAGRNEQDAVVADFWRLLTPYLAVELLATHPLAIARGLTKSDFEAILLAEDSSTERDEG